jgi:hypothetical protein
MPPPSSQYAHRDDVERGVEVVVAMQSPPSRALSVREPPGYDGAFSTPRHKVFPLRDSRSLIDRFATFSWCFMVLYQREMLSLHTSHSLNVSVTRAQHNPRLLLDDVNYAEAGLATLARLPNPTPSSSLRLRLAHYAPAGDALTPAGLFRTLPQHSIFRPEFLSKALVRCVQSIRRCPD